MDGVGWCLAAVFVFAVVSFFFSFARLALQMFSRVRLADAYKLANRDNRTDELAENQERLILACSFYWRVSNLCLFVSLAAFFFNSSGDVGIQNFALLFIVASAITVFNLAISFAWAKYVGEKILIRIYTALKFFMVIAWPIMSLFNLNDLLVRRLSGYAEASPEEEQDEKQEEFLSVVEEQMMEGVVDAEQQEMIEHVIELDETTADEIMTPRTDVIAIDVSSSLETVLKSITSAGHSRIPVYEETIDKIIGMVYAKDMLAQIGKDPADFNLRDNLRQAYFVPETKLLRILLNEFRNRKLHIAVVLDEYGGTAGIVTIEDILEELVGEIEDEYEQSQPDGISRIDENTIDIDARTYIDDFNNEFDVKLPEDEDYDTVGGFVFSHLGYIPATGEQFEYENLKFTISQAEQRSVKRVRIEKIAGKETVGQ